MDKNLCKSCGMPVDENTKYCKYCTDESGKLKEFRVKLGEMTDFVASKMNVDKDEAQEIASCDQWINPKIMAEAAKITGIEKLRSLSAVNARPRKIISSAIATRVRPRVISSM